MGEQRKPLFGRGWSKLWVSLLLTVIALSILGGASSASAASFGDKKMMIIYFSWGGNTKSIAEQIQSLTGADIFELKAVTPYPKEYGATTKQARQELDSGYRPRLSGTIDNLAEYDVVFIGFPNWWGTMPMPLFTFLEANSLSGKTIAPFITHGGGAFGRALNDLKNLCPEASIIEGLAVRGDQVGRAKPETTQWLKKIEMIQ